MVLTSLSTLFQLYRSTRRKPPTCRESLTNFITTCCIEYTSPWAWFEITTLVVIGTDCIDSCKSTYHNETRSTLGMGCSLIVIWRTLDSRLSFQFHWTYTNYFTRDISYHSISCFLDHCCVSVSDMSCW